MWLDPRSTRPPSTNLTHDLDGVRVQKDITPDPWLKRDDLLVGFTVHCTFLVY
jgi:hypothetical protein